VIIKKESDFKPAPEGLHHAVCVDIIDLGIVDTGGFGPKHQLRLVWEIEATTETGERFTCRKQYTVSLHEKANLRKDLKDWRGKDFTSAELEGFDIDKLLGAPCQILIKHVEKEGNVYGNVATILKPAKALPPSGKYIRVKDRPVSEKNGGTSSSQSSGVGKEEVPDADLIPF
jgi:hypothetical protein